MNPNEMKIYRLTGTNGIETMFGDDASVEQYLSENTHIDLRVEHVIELPENMEIMNDIENVRRIIGLIVALGNTINDSVITRSLEILVERVWDEAQKALKEKEA